MTEEERYFFDVRGYLTWQRPPGRGYVVSPA